jgi:acyl dehydratase
VGEELPRLSRVVTREDVRAYAEAGGDRNPLHLDDEVAREAGFDGVIAHGMFTMGHMAACVVAWAGDPAAVTSVSAAFRAPVSMGQEIVAGGRVRALDDDARTATLELWVSSERDGATEWPIKRGEATVRLG